MEWYFALVLLLGTVCTAMFLGLPVAFAFFAANILGTFLFVNGDIGLVLMPLEFHNAIKFTLAPICLFLWMGEILLQTGVAFKAIGAIDRLIARVPGRLAVVSIVGGTIFSSLSGSTIANTAILGSVLLPDMMKRGYKPAISMGPIMAVGGIAMLIPPSALAVLLASLAEQSVAQLLIAGIVPGILMATLFFAYVVGRCLLDPSLAPTYQQDDSGLDLPITVSLNTKAGERWSWPYAGNARRFLNRILPFLLDVDKNVIRIRTTEQPAGVSHDEVFVVVPGTKRSRVRPVDLQSDRRNAPDAAVPERGPGSVVLVARNDSHRRVLFQIAQVVSTGVGKRPGTKAAHQAGIGQQLPANPIRLHFGIGFDKCVSSNRHRVLRKQPRQLLSIGREHHVAFAELCDVLQQSRVDILVRTKPNDADRNSAGSKLLQQRLVSTGLFAVLGI